MAMLDNLKLGYGGTKAELERLIKDAASYTDIQKQMGVTVDESSMSFDNIVNAIAVVQGKLGIAGATAQEAATTIEGSVISMKGAWQNLVVGIADDNADFSQLMTNFVDSVDTVAENILPRVQIALTGVGDLIDGLFPVIVEKIPAIFESVIPKLAESAVKIVESLINGISQNQEMLVTTAFSVIMTLVNGFLSLLPKVLQLGLSLIVTLATGIAENIDTLLPSIVETITGMYEMFTAPEQLSKMLKAALDLIVKLAYGIIEAIPELIDCAFQVIDNLVTFLTDPSNLAMLVSTALELIVALAGGLISAIPKLLSAVGELITSLVNKFKEKDWGQTGRDIIDKILSGLKNAWANVKSWFTNAWNSLFSNRTVNVGAKVNSGGVNGSHAGGLDYVPFDGYIAELHKGEQVLTASEAKAYRQGGGSVNVVQNIYSQAKTAADLMQEAKYQQERAVLLGV